MVTDLESADLKIDKVCISLPAWPVLVCVAYLTFKVHSVWPWFILSFVLKRNYSLPPTSFVFKSFKYFSKTASCLLSSSLASSVPSLALL